MDRLRGSQSRLDRKGSQALLQMNQIIEDVSEHASCVASQHLMPLH